MSKTLIAIPAYNAERFIVRTLRSCVNQTLKSEILVVDNCSTDCTREIVQGFQKEHDGIRLVINQTNVGRIGNFNRCLDLFDGSPCEYLKFVFTGDELLRKCVAEVERIFEEQQGLSLVMWPYLFRNKDGSSSVARRFGATKRLTREDMINEGYFTDGLGAVVCQAVAKWAIGGARFNEAFLGIRSFADQVVLRGDVYHYDKVLSVFNVDGHQSFGKQFGYLYALETSYTTRLGLERNKDWIEPSRYRLLSDELMLRSVVIQMKHFRATLALKAFCRLLCPRLMALIWRLRRIRTKRVDGYDTNT